MKFLSYILRVLGSIFFITSIGHAQTCLTKNIHSTTPNSRFEIINKGSEVKDKVTGLIWQRCSVGQMWDGTTCTGTATTYIWKQALTVAKNQGNGYRLPNIKELQSIVEYQCREPAINSKIFPNTPNPHNNGTAGVYITSTPVIHAKYYVWGIYFYGSGQISGQSLKANTDRYYVRAVRSE